MVIDLRHNPGEDTFSLGDGGRGIFDRAVDCGTFITRSGTRSAKNSWQFGSADYRGRMVVLVDSSTASAVLASWYYRLPGGGELQLSREDYVAPKGRRIEGQGVEPDVVVPLTLEDVRRGRDRDLEAALRVLAEANAKMES